MRLFVALDIDPAIRERMARFLDGVREFAADVRWVRAESLHITLKFIGEQPDHKLENIQKTLAEIRSPATRLNFHGYGFFPTPRSARVFWVGLDADEHLAKLADRVEQALHCAFTFRAEGDGIIFHTLEHLKFVRTLRTLITIRGQLHTSRKKMITALDAPASLRARTAQ